MIVVTSSADYVRSPWVKAEWQLFLTEKRSGNKKGNLVTMIVGDVDAGTLPASLRFYEVMRHGVEEFPRLLRYVGRGAN